MMNDNQFKGTISRNIMRTGDYPGPPSPTIFYKAQCSCDSPDDIMDICIESSEEDMKDGLVVINFHAQLKDYFHSFYGNSQSVRWCNRWKRIKTALKVIFSGTIEINETFLLEGEQQIRDFIDALEEGVEYVKKNKK